MSRGGKEKLRGAGALCCPVCGLPLSAGRGVMTCGRGHSYDIAREGYVNLLMSNQSSSRRHGDDRVMIEARACFLDKGYYRPIADALADMTAPYVRSGGTVLDAGCGDGWYSALLIDRYAENGVYPEYIGIDISKAALKAASRRGADMTLAVASAYRLPVAESRCDAVLSVFAPTAADEFRRVLAKGGMLFTVTARPRHLYGLKATVYDRPYENEEGGAELPGFELREQKNVDFGLALEGDSIMQLFMMTPYYYKTSREDQSKLEATSRLETEVSAAIRRYEAR